MSEFDKEEERRKLREKYEADREKREATQRMSELLLKGATMTNKHCDRCGDPIFRYQGQEFCPTCQREQNAQNAGQQNAQNAGQQNAQNAGQQNAQNAGQQRAGQQNAQDAGQQRAGQQNAQDAEQQNAGQQDATAPERTAESEAEASRQATGGDDAGTAVGAQSPATDREQPPSPQAESGDLDAATASLRRTVTKHAEAAERAADPRRARDHLAVVRDAAEALAALDR
jgi:uncharacterized Zn finger protein (UPF0148 family)